MCLWLLLAGGDSEESFSEDDVSEIQQEGLSGCVDWGETLECAGAECHIYSDLN